LSDTHPAHPATRAILAFGARRSSVLEPVVRKFWAAALRLSPGIHAVT